nr:hydroxyacylglutathione hydrolase-like protein isoform X2 [Saimiri boliviensis boliviensis]
MKVKVIPVLEDNYMYLVIEELTREAVAVDVAVPKRLLEIVGREGVSLTAVLTTHHHWDHARGNPELARLRPGLAVLGADERIFSLTRRLAHGEELRVSARPREGGVGAPGPPSLTRPPAPPPQFGAIHVRCLLTPGHTSGHMSYFLWEDDCPDPPALFSGDALLVAGCGSCLEGSAQQMYQSLAELGTLPPETVFCGHEHTLSNLEFAQKVEPCNDHVRAKLSWAKARPLPASAGGWGRTGFGGSQTSPSDDQSLWSLQKRDEDDVPTVPSTLGEERLYNPFLRVAEEPVRKFTGKAVPADVLEALCKERARFEQAGEPRQPQARALLALQWGLLSAAPNK